MVVVARAADQPSRVVTYPIPDGVPQNETFAVKVRTPGGEWQPVGCYLVTVDRVQLSGHERQRSSMALFDFSGKVEVAVSYRGGPIASARVRPLSYGISATISGDTIAFTLDRPRNLSVEVNGDLFGNLQLFASPVEANPPDPKDPNVIYFGPGVHDLQTPAGQPELPMPPPPPSRADGQPARPFDNQRRANFREAMRRTLRVPSGKTVYLAGGAVVRGRIFCDRAQNVRIFGHGIIAQSEWGGGIRIANSENVTVSGVFTPQCFTGGSHHVTIENVKCISFVGNGDGMNVICSEDVTIDGVFNRNSDDCVTVYGRRSGFVGDARRIVVRNSTLWADVAHPILVGTHGNPSAPETLEDLTFANLDLLDQMEPQLNYQGMMALNAGDSNLIRNVRFEDIRVEDFRQGQLVNLRVFFNRKYCTAPGRGIENVLFKNIVYRGTHASTSIIWGYDEQRGIKNVLFENLVINGVTISDEMKKPGWYTAADMAGFAVGEHVEGLVFRASQ